MQVSTSICQQRPSCVIGFFLIAPPSIEIYGPPRKVMAPLFIAPSKKLWPPLKIYVPEAIKIVIIIIF